MDINNNNKYNSLIMYNLYVYLIVQKYFKENFSERKKKRYKI